MQTSKTPIITDRPRLVGYKDGSDTGYGDRTYRKSRLPAAQQEEYHKGFKLGYRQGLKDSEAIDRELAEEAESG